MTNGALSASSRPTRRQSLQVPWCTSSHIAVSAGMPMAGSAVTTIATAPWVHSLWAALKAALALMASLYAAHHSADGKRRGEVELMLRATVVQGQGVRQTLPSRVRCAAQVRGRDSEVVASFNAR